MTIRDDDVVGVGRSAPTRSHSERPRSRSPRRQEALRVDTPGYPSNAELVHSVIALVQKITQSDDSLSTVYLIC